MKCKTCGSEFDPLKVKNGLRFFNVEYNGILCYDCAIELVYRKNNTITMGTCLSRDDLGRLYKEAIDREIVMVDFLLEQLSSISERIQELSDELITLKELQDVSPEELAKDLWVRENITIDTEFFSK